MCSIEDFRKQNVYLLVRVQELGEKNHRLSTENIDVKEDNLRMLQDVRSSAKEKAKFIDMYEKAAASFERAMDNLAPKRARPAEEEDEERQRQEGIDLYASGLIELRDAEHKKKTDELKAEHSREVKRLKTKAEEPINEFRISKQFHIKEASLNTEMQRLQYALKEEKKKSVAVDWDAREKAYMKQDLKEMKKRCVDGEVRILELEAKVKKSSDRILEGDPRLESEEELLARVDELMEERDALVARSVREIDEKTQLLAAAEKELDQKTLEAEKLKACLEGRFKIGAPAPPNKTQFCSPCTKLHDSTIQTLTLKHTEDVDALQRELGRIRRVLDKGIEAKDLAERFHDRERELRARLENTEKALSAATNDVKHSKSLLTNKHDMTVKCKRQVKAMEIKCAAYDGMKARNDELEKSVMGDSVVSDLSKKHQAQLLRATRAHTAARDTALQLAVDLDAEQLRVRMGAMYEEDLLLAYRTLRAEYNRDTGRAPSVQRPRKGGDGDWLDGESEGEPKGD